MSARAGSHTSPTDGLTHSFFFFDWRCTSAPIICAFGARPVKEDEPLPPTTELRPILSPAHTASEPAR